MSQDNLIKLVCSECDKSVYFTTKNKRKLREHKLVLKKMCKSACKKHTDHKETK